MAEKATQVSLSMPSLAAVFHDYYKDQPNGEATLEQKIAIQDGTQKLPSGSHLRLDCDPAFQPPITNREDGWLISYPTWRFRFYEADTGVLKHEATIGNGGVYASEGWVWIQGPETDTSLFQKSLGYAPVFGLDGQPYKGRIEITVECPGMVSPPLVLPWVEHN